MKNLNDTKELTYLCVNNPWRWKENIENIINKSTTEKLKKIFNEICIAYSCNMNLNRKDLSWYFRKDLTQEIISPGYINKKYNSNNAECLIHDMIDDREKSMKQYLKDVEKIYILCKNEMTKRDLGNYPDQLEDLFS